ncbi:hypothetical protein AAFF_G00290730 [Aldrovandia affinis]|uniref:ATP-dependent DNA helicase n=1 Tax=Aldrovandia affinis TaxID=143900 RepID=A0AAD7W1C7_9TELE|nr:hypothetical protein AAFF_G00290730 [Aldrovandia affinis]
MTHDEYQECVKALTCGMVVMMKREPKDCRVNGYNPDLLRAWNANMDIQFILDEFSCIMYMMSYVAKPEHEMTKFLNSVIRDVKKSNVNERDEMKQIMQAYAKHREVSAQESVARRQVIHPDEQEEQDQIPDYEVHGLYSGAMPAIDTLKLSQDFVRSMYRSLNKTQASVFYTVREWCLKRVWGHNPEPLFYFISGGAGCGKSHVIKCIYQEATKILRQLPRFLDEADMSQPAVLLTAFTGTAAFNISEILIIDKISMVSKELFAYVHWRFQQIKGNRKPFGGMSVLVVGDFYQLPPIKAKQLCVCEDDVLDLWKDFQMVNLTEIMRQKDDRAFAKLLNRIRTKKKMDPLSVDDTALLTQAVAEIKDCPPDALHIFATNKEVDAHNAATVTALRLQVINIPAED